MKVKPFEICGRLLYDNVGFYSYEGNLWHY